MKARHLLSLTAYWAKSVLGFRLGPILGTVIVTDACNLACEHCAVANIRGTHYPFSAVCADMLALYREGVRAVFLSGGETLLWRDGDRDVNDLVKEAHRIGFRYVAVNTNGTIGLDLPEADLVMVSLDGGRESHDSIRGETFDRIMAAIDAATAPNICLYMAVNTRNVQDIQLVCALARRHEKIRSVSFNIHTPYPGTEHLSLTPEQRRRAACTVKRMMSEGYPVFNIPAGVDAWLDGNWPRPCRQCALMENGQRYVCGRCSEVDGLCAQCGYMFAVEFSLVFQPRLAAVWQMLRTYPRYA